MINKIKSFYPFDDTHIDLQKDPIRRDAPYNKHYFNSEKKIIPCKYNKVLNKRKVIYNNPRSGCIPLIKSRIDSKPIGNFVYYKNPAKDEFFDKNWPGCLVIKWLALNCILL